MDCVVLNGGRADRFGLGSEMDGDAAAREDACREYQSSLEDLTFNSKPHINMLTILAEENLHFAKDIVAIIEAQITKAPPSEKLPVLYLVDSIVKNVGGEYLAVFAKNLVTSFICVFEKVDENIRKSLYKLRSTWDDVFPLKKLYALDVRVNSVDSAWPIKPLPLTVNASIHVNPKFLKQSDEAPPRPRSTVPPPAATPPLAPSASEGQLIRQQLLAKQKQLLELQQKKIELELEQTKAQLAGGFVLTPTVPQASGPVVPATAPKSASQTAPAIRPWVPPQPETKPSARDPRLHRPGPPATPQSKDQPSANKDGQSLGGTAQNAEKRLLEKSGRVDKPRPQKKAAREEKPKSPPPMPKGAPSRGKHSEADSSKKDPRLQKRTHDKSGDTREEEKKKRSTEIKKEREETPRALHPLRPAKAKPVNGSLSKHDQAQSAEKADFQSGGNARTNARKRTHSRSRSPTTAISCSPKRKDRRSPKGRARSNSSSPSPSHLQGKVRRAHTDEPLRGKAGREDRAPPKKSLTEPKRAKRPLGERDTHSPRGHSEARETKEVPHRWRSGWEDNKHLKKSEDAHGNPGPQRQKPYVSSRPTTPRMLKHRLSVDTNLQIPDVLNSASKRDLLMRASKRLESGEISQDDFLNVAHQIQQLFKYQEEKQQQRSDSWEASDNDAPPPKKVLPTHSTMDDAELSYYEHKSKLRRTRVNHPPGGSGEEWEAERRQEEEPPPNPEASPGSSRSSPHKYTEPPRERPADRRSKEREEPLPHTPMIEEYNHGKEFPTLKSLHGLRFRRRADPRDSSEREWNSPLTERQRYDREKHKSGYDAPRRYAGHPDPRNTDPHRPERLPLPATVVHRKCPSPTNVEAPPAGYERERLSPLHQAEAAELSPLPMFESPNSEHSDDGPLGTDAPLVHPIHPPRPPILKALSHAAGTLALVRQHSDSPEHTPPQDGGAPSTRYEGPSHNGPPRPPPPGRYEAGRPGRYGDPSCYNGPHHQVRQGIPERPDGPAQYDGPPVPHGPMGGSMGRGMGRFDGPPLPQGQNRYEAPICQQPPVRFDGPGPGPMQRFDGPVRFENNAGGGPGPMGFQPRPMHFDSASNQMGPMRFEGPGAMRFNGPGPMFGPLHNMQAPMRPVAPYDNPTPAQQNFNMVNQCFPEAINPPQYSAGPLPFPVQQNLSQTGGGDFSMQPGPPFTQPAAPPFYNPALPTAGNIQQPVNMMPNLNQTFLSQNPVPFRQPGAPFSAPESHFGQVDVNDLLTKLISTGIIPASTTSKQESSEPSGTEPSSAPQAVQGPEEEEQEDDDDIPDLTGFVIVDMKLRYGSVVTKLYTGIQCYSCGMRFTASQTDVYADHLDWHYRQNRSEKDISRKITHRRWYYTLKDWIEFEEIADLEERAKSHFFEKVNEEEVQRSQEAAKQDEFQSVKATADVVGESCEICQEAFEMYWEEEEEEWHLKNALRVEGKTYHPSCYEDYKNTSSFLDATPSPSVTPAEHPLSAFVKKEVDEEEAASCLASVKQEAEPEAGEVARIKKEDEGSTEDPQSA